MDAWDAMLAAELSRRQLGQLALAECARQQTPDWLRVPEPTLQDRVGDRLEQLTLDGTLIDGATVGIHVYDPTANEVLVSLNDDVPMPWASVAKLQIATAFVDKASEERQGWLGPKSRRHLKYALEAVINRWSIDRVIGQYPHTNVSATWLVRQVRNPEEVQSRTTGSYGDIFQQASFTSIIPGSGKEYHNLGTAQDAVRYFRQMHTCPERFFEADRLIRHHEQAKTRFTRHTRTIPEGTRVWNKTGRTIMMNADTGCIFFQDPYGGVRPIFASVLIKSPDLYQHLRGVERTRADRAVKEKGPIVISAIGDLIAQDAHKRYDVQLRT